MSSHSCIYVFSCMATDIANLAFFHFRIIIVCKVYCAQGITSFTADFFVKIPTFQNSPSIHLLPS